MSLRPPSSSAKTSPAWSGAELDQPHADPEKARRVEQMFAAIAGRYDLNNRVHSFGRDQAWRRAAVEMAMLQPGDRVVDVACGTGDLTFAFATALHELSPEAPPTLGIDFTQAMLDVARQKTAKTLGDNRSPRVEFRHGDATRLDLPDASCDVVSIAFGIRNVDQPAQALSEFHRVLRPGGRLIVLEFTVPTNPLFRAGHDLYCGKIMPRTASLIAGDRSGAYHYLPRSVNTFASRQQMLDSMSGSGFRQTVSRKLTFGIAHCYRGLKTDH